MRCDRNSSPAIPMRTTVSVVARKGRGINSPRRSSKMFGLTGAITASKRSIRRTSKNRPSMCEVLSILPKEFVFENVMADLDDNQIDEVLERIRDQMLAMRETSDAVH